MEIRFLVECVNDITKAQAVLSALVPVFGEAAAPVTAPATVATKPSSRKAKVAEQAAADPAAAYAALTGETAVEARAEAIAASENVVVLPATPAEPEVSVASMTPAEARLALFALCSANGFKWARDVVLEGKYPNLSALSDDQVVAKLTEYNRKEVAA